MGKLKCFNGKKHQGDYLVEVFRSSSLGFGAGEKVIRWCRICGAVVVDNESDGKRVGTFLKMQFPEMVHKHFIKKEKNEKKS